MEFSYFKNIKKDCVKSVFDVIAYSKETTRNEISEKCGYSLVTVGKVIDAFQDMGIINQKLKSRTGAGRKSNAISLSRDRLIQILDFSRDNFTFSIYNLDAEIIDAISFYYNENYFFDENLTFFLKDISKYVKRNFSYDVFIGTGISISGEYSSGQNARIGGDQIQSVNLETLKDLILQYLKPQIIISESNLHSSLLYNIRGIKNYKNLAILYCLIRSDRASGALIANGKIINGFPTSPVIAHRLSAHNGTSLENILKSSASQEKIVWELCCVLNNLLRVISPNVLFIESDVYGDAKNTIDLIVKNLIENFDFSPEDVPKVIIKRYSELTSHKGLAVNIRNLWIDRLISDDKKSSNC